MNDLHDSPLEHELLAESAMSNQPSIPDLSKSLDVNLEIVNDTFGEDEDDGVDWVALNAAMGFPPITDDISDEAIYGATPEIRAAAEYAGAIEMEQESEVSELDAAARDFYSRAAPDQWIPPETADRIIASMVAEMEEGIYEAEVWREKFDAYADRVSNSLGLDEDGRMANGEFFDSYASPAEACEVAELQLADDPDFAWAALETDKPGFADLVTENDDVPVFYPDNLLVEDCDLTTIDDDNPLFDNPFDCDFS